MNDINQQKEHFTSVAHRYIESRRHRNHLTLKAAIWRYFLSRNPFPTEQAESLSVIEPMCGYGEGYEILKNYGHCRFVYRGSDISAPMVAEAMRRYPGVEFAIGDVTKPFGADEYDIVLILGGLHHVFRHITTVLSNVRAALKPGGYFINLEPTENNMVFTAIRNHIYRTNDLFDAETERGFALEELNRLYEDAGLLLKDQIYPGLLAYVLYYNPDAFPSLNIGNPWLVSKLFALERVFYSWFIGRKLSFATLSLLQRPPGPRQSDHRPQ